MVKVQDKSLLKTQLSCIWFSPAMARMEARDGQLVYGTVLAHSYGNGLLILLDPKHFLKTRPTLTKAQQ